MSRPDASSTPAVQVSDLVIDRGTTRILRGVSCRMQAGSVTAILGPNGCGKTTFARTLTGHCFPTHGTVQVLGRTIGATDVRALRREIGVVSPAVDAGEHVSGAVVDAALSTTEAVCTGYFASVGLYDPLSDAQRAHARQLLDHVGLGHRLDHRFGTLSTGEQRRAIIARALVHMPRLLILDEPTAGLDLAGREQVLATIERVVAQPDPPAVLMITHHVEELSPRTAQVLLMRDGQFVASGSPARIITPETLSATFQCKVFVRRLHGRYWLEVLPEAWVELLRDAPGSAAPSRTGRRI